MERRAGYPLQPDGKKCRAETYGCTIKIFITFTLQKKVRQIWEAASIQGQAAEKQIPGKNAEWAPVS